MNAMPCGWRFSMPMVADEWSPVSIFHTLILRRSHHLRHTWVKVRVVAVPHRIREEHGRRLQNELHAALGLADALRPTDERLEPPEGIFIEVELRAGAKADVLEHRRANIRPGAVKATDTNDRIVALYVPDHARPILDQILEDYLNGPLTGRAQNPPNKTRVEAIEAIRTARLETFWTDDQKALPKNPHDQMWWALWCWKGNEARIEKVCARLGTRAAGPDRRLYFPEIVVIPVLATRAAIELMLFATDMIAELRRANDSPTFFIDDVRANQHPWTDDLATRIVWPPSDATAVCLFDTGVNRAHSLIEPALAPIDLHALNEDWDVMTAIPMVMEHLWLEWRYMAI